MCPSFIDRKIAATDHEPTDARKSFPCFDEPNKKATYSISIIHDDSYKALSNMPLEVGLKSSTQTWTRSMLLYFKMLHIEKEKKKFW